MIPDLVAYLKATQLTSEVGSISSTIFCKYKVDEYQSEVLNSYGIFQPTGPNFLRSWTTEWRNEITYNIGLYCGMLE